MSADLARIEADITECLRRLRKARDTDDADAEMVFDEALERLFERRARLAGQQ